MNNNLVILTNIHKLVIDGKIDLAKKYFKECSNITKSQLQIYRRMEALLLFYDGEVDTSINLLKENILDNIDKYPINQDAYYLVLFLIKSSKYEEAYKYVKYIDYSSLMVKTKVAFKNASKMIHYLNRLFNIDDLNNMDYQDMQERDYSLDRAFDHICERHNYILDDNSYSFILNYEDLVKLVDLINKAIIISEKTIDVNFNDVYYFKINNIGYNPNTLEYTDYIKVYTLPNESKIMTMYPIRYRKNNNWNIMEFKENFEEYTSNIKRVRTNQIDKFNKKYNR